MLVCGTRAVTSIEVVLSGSGSWSCTLLYGTKESSEARVKSLEAEGVVFFSDCLAKGISSHVGWTKLLRNSTNYVDKTRKEGAEGKTTLVQLGDNTQSANLCIDKLNEKIPTARPL